MTAYVHRDPLLRLLGAAGRQLARRPYLSVSVALHAVALGLLYVFGSYQLGLSERAAEAVEVASSLRATQEASTTKRLQDLQTIKELLEKSAGRDEAGAGAEPARPAEPPPRTPEEALARARELARDIETLDKQIQAEELAKLTGKPRPPPAAEAVPAPPAAQAPSAPVRRDADVQAADDAASQPAEVGMAAQPPSAEASGVPGPGASPVTAEAAAGEVAALETKARETLARRLQRLEAKANGVRVEARRQGDSASGGQGAAGVRAEIAGFIGRATERTSRSTRYTAGTDVFDRGRAEIPPVDVSSLVLGQGRMFGAGGEYANRVYLNSWYIIGPFDGRHGAGMFNNPPHPPEKAVLLDAVYYGKDGRLLRWRYVTAQSYPLVLTNNVEDSVYYGYTEVSVDRDCDLTAWIGADDDVQVYLNDQMVWKGGNVNKATYFDAIFNQDRGYLRDYNRTEGRRVLHFNKGRNKLFFKLSNGPNGAFLSMVLTR